MFIVFCISVSVKKGKFEISKHELSPQKVFLQVAEISLQFIK